MLWPIFADVFFVIFAIFTIIAIFVSRQIKGNVLRVITSRKNKLEICGIFYLNCIYLKILHYKFWNILLNIPPSININGRWFD